MTEKGEELLGGYNYQCDSAVFRLLSANFCLYLYRSRLARITSRFSLKIRNEGKVINKTNLQIL